jgi:hypothetical protein
MYSTLFFVGETVSFGAERTWLSSLRTENHYIPFFWRRIRSLLPQNDIFAYPALVNDIAYETEKESSIEQGQALLG